MLTNLVLIVVIIVCVWGVLNPKVQTRTMGTLALSMIAILALAGLC